MVRGREDEKRENSVKTLENGVLRRWQEKSIFRKSLEKNPENKSFIFYDGPPFATGLPHYGHLLASTIKDAIPRYKTMRGMYVRRVWGWDCHGLPIENLVEKELSLDHKKDIEKYGIAKFNLKARDSVLRHESGWKNVIQRLGRFIDMDGAYKTMDASYTESIWWAFKTLYKKGLMYEGYKSMHICPRCETTLANYEVTLGYKDIKDIAITVKFPILGEKETYLLAWTTTPWTLPGNVALAVDPRSQYVKFKKEGVGGKYIVAEDRLESLGENIEVIEKIKGKSLIGLSYKPPFENYYHKKDIEGRENGWKVYGASFVTTDTGVGIVHIAPAFGEDDMELGKLESLPFIQHVKMDGTFADEMDNLAGLSVKPKSENKDGHMVTDIAVLRQLVKDDLVFAKEKVEHSYPHCWRCDTPLLNYAATSWFVKVTEIKNQLVRQNNDIKWVPEIIGTGRFGKWLEDARDWGVSRLRYWGAPIPVWHCDNCNNNEVIGSVEELKEHIIPSSNKYIVMRHGQSEGNVEGLVSSILVNKDELTEKGRKQALSSAEKLQSENIDFIISSNFLRTKETAEIVAKKLGIPQDKIIFDKRLWEINAGEFNGRPNSEYRLYFKNTLQKFTRNTPGGENLREVSIRAMDFLYDVDAQYKNKKILIVTHEYIAWLLFARVMGLDDRGAADLKDNGGDDFLNNAEFRNLEFKPLPHGLDYMLDLHRPYIDSVVWRCSCGGVYKRVPDVFDCWFESGAMPFAQYHYPFEEEKEFLKKHYPADFIAEGIDQTRGWFYTLMVLGTALFNKAPFKSVIVNGLIMAEDGQKMSKRLNNYPDPIYIIDTYGADALRYYLLSSHVVRGENLNFSEAGVDEIYKKITLRLINILNFYDLHAKNTLIDDVQKEPKSDNILDKWIIARLYETIKSTEDGYDNYELERAVRPASLFVEDLSTWYVRRSRNRLKESGQDKIAALATLRFVLIEFSKALAPTMPFISDEIFCKLRHPGDAESVHLSDWPAAKKPDKEIIVNMERVREAITLGLEARARSGIKVRQPLKTLKTKIPIDDDYLQLILDEVNVKEYVSLPTSSDEAAWIDINVTQDLRDEGRLRELTRFIQDLRKSEGMVHNEAATLLFSAEGAALDFIKSIENDLKKITNVDALVHAPDVDGLDVMIDELKFILKVRPS